MLEDPRLPASNTLWDQAHNAIDRKLFAMKGFHHPGGSQPGFLTGLAHLYQPDPLPAPRPACGPVWGGSGRRQGPDTRLVAQSPNPHFRRLSPSGDPLHYIIRWNVGGGAIRLSTVSH